MKNEKSGLVFQTMDNANPLFRELGLTVLEVICRFVKPGNDLIFASEGRAVIIEAIDNGLIKFVETDVLVQALKALPEDWDELRRRVSSYQTPEGERVIDIDFCPCSKCNFTAITHGRLTISGVNVLETDYSFEGGFISILEKVNNEDLTPRQAAQFAKKLAQLENFLSTVGVAEIAIEQECIRQLQKEFVNLSLEAAKKMAFYILSENPPASFHSSNN